MMVARASQSQETQTSSPAGGPAPFPDIPPPGFAIYEEYNRIQLAFMMVMRVVLRRERFYGWPPED
jgi:hypothetical protein